MFKMSERRHAAVREVRHIGVGDKRADRFSFALRGFKIAGLHEGFASRVMPCALEERHRVARIFRFKNFLRVGELNLGVVRRGLDRLHPRRRSGHVDGQFRVEFFGHRKRGFTVARHLRRRHREMNVVREVAVLIKNAGVRVFEISLVRSDRVDIVLKRLLETANAVIGVRRHMDEVTEARRQRRETVGMVRRPVGVARGFRNVNVKVDRRRVIRLTGEHAFEQRHGARGAPLWRAAAIRPVIPGLRVHVGFGGQRRDEVVVGVFEGDLIHCVRERIVEFRPVDQRRRFIAIAERVDQRLFFFAGVLTKRERLTQRRPMPARPRRPSSVR